MKKGITIYSILILLFVFLLITIGCQQDQTGQQIDQQESKEEKSIPAGKNTVLLKNSTFEPSEISIKKGETITWKNEDGYDHTVTSQENASGVNFDKSLSGGQTFKFKFEKSGGYPYACTIHPGMTGTVVVK